jgi:hypothetical protein
MSEYKYYAVETFRNPSEQSSASVRVRPLPGQGLPTDMRVECSRKMRKSHALRTIFKIQAKITDREGGTTFLYSSHNWPYTVITFKESEEFIKNKF